MSGRERTHRISSIGDDISLNEIDEQTESTDKETGEPAAEETK